METGDKISADGRLIESCALHADEASLTGESEPAAKDADVVLEKRGYACRRAFEYAVFRLLYYKRQRQDGVTAVGDRTEFGKIARELSATEKSSTPLQEKMAKLGKLITLLGAIAAGIVFLIQLFTFACEWNRVPRYDIRSLHHKYHTDCRGCAGGASTIVAVSLAINIIKMAKQNALVKKMIACETVGCINVILLG